jgi:hypothetical protein
MKRSRLGIGLVCGLVAAAPVWPAEPTAGERSPAAGLGPLTAAEFQQPSEKIEPPPKAKLPPAPPPEAPPAVDLFARAPALGGEAPAGTFSREMGDWIGIYYANRTFRVPTTRTITTLVPRTQTTTQVIDTQLPPPNAGGEPTFVRTIITTTTVTQVPVTSVQQGVTSVNARVPVVTRGGFKVAENESPIPEDRIFLTYNFYNDVTGTVFGGGSPRIETRSAVIGGNPTLITSVIPGGAVGPFDVHREVVGFEKTFLDGNASIGLRAPLFQQQGDGSFAGDDFGDLSIVFKGLLWADDAGDAFSAGLVVTAPTGPSIPTVVGDIHSTLLQPWVGGVLSRGNFYAMGFSSVVVPTDARDVTLLFNDLSVGYAVYRAPEGRGITALVPTFEVHVTTPLNQRSILAPLSVPDLVVLTEGVQIVLGSRSTLAVGVAVPVTGPRPFDLEALAQFNLRF